MQVMATVVSSDQENDSDVLPCSRLGAVDALGHSLPRAGRRRARRRIDGQLIVNPTFPRSTRATWTWWWRAPPRTSSWSRRLPEIPEADVVQALEFATGHIRRWSSSSTNWSRAAKPKRPVIAKVDVAEIEQESAVSIPIAQGAIRIPAKEQRQEEIDNTAAEAVASLSEKYGTRPSTSVRSFTTSSGTCFAR